MLSVIKQGEHGYKEAMIGLSFNKKRTTAEMRAVAKKLAFMDRGHNKFLEAIYLWLEVRASRYWWQEADTYRISTKQSESTMHTLINEIKNFDIDDVSLQGPKALYLRQNFEPGSVCAEQFNGLIQHAKDDDISATKKMLPEGFLQRRLWVINYQCFRNIILQRRNHRLPLWPKFIESLLQQVEHPELLPTLEG